MDANGAFNFPAAAIQRAQCKMGLDRIGVRVHELEEHIERAIRLLGDEIIEPGQIIGVQFAERRGPALTPAEVSGEYPQDQRRNHQDPSQKRKVGHWPKTAWLAAPLIAD